MNQTFFDDRRAALHQRLAEVAQRTAGVQKHLRGEDGRLDADFGDVAAFTWADEVLEQLDAGGRAEIGEIQAALARLDAGVYGDCVACGGEIAEGRLTALPTAARCVACESVSGR